MPKLLPSVPAVIPPQNYQQLEMLIDRNGLKAVLCAVADICGEKADHIRENWQDHVLANRWFEARDQVNACACRLPPEVEAG